jgi:hypothetical protein
MTSRLLKTLHEAAADFGLRNQQTMREFGAVSCPTVRHAPLALVVSIFKAKPADFSG